MASKSRLQIAQEKAEAAIKKTNQKIIELGKHTGGLYNDLTTIQLLFDRIRNVPEEKRLQYEQLKEIRLNWKKQAEKIELEYKKAEVKAAGQGAAGVGAGIAVAALGPTAAMGIATTFGVASTGTAIASLSGAAATNAALAWLGGGALAAGGGGMAAGNLFLAMAGPVGWAIAGVSIVSSGLMFFKAKSDKERLENVFTHISNRDVKSYELAIVELNERIKRIKNETVQLQSAIEKIKTFGTNYNEMTESQQYELGAYVNLMESSTMLVVNPILGLMPKFGEEDFNKFCNQNTGKLNVSEHTLFLIEYSRRHKKMIMTLANLLYKIDLDEKDRKLLAKSFRKNKEFLASINMNKKDFDAYDISIVQSVLRFKYSYSTY
jgi:hypothetical protein